MSQSDRTEFEAALARLLDGEPEPGDGELLARTMRDDPAVRREASGLLAVDELLRQNAELSENDFADGFAERLEDAADESFVRRMHGALPSGASFWQRRGWQLAAAAVIFAGIAVFALRLARDPRADVATLLLAENCQWQEPAAAQEGMRVMTGPLRLRQGLAVLRFDGGAELILRGDTEVELQSVGQARLVCGDVTVRAPEEAAGFKLLTPASEVVDLGTEFAARVERSGATELHVLEGEIAITSAASGGRRGEVLHAGKAVRFDNSKVATPREVQMHADRFEEIVRAARPAARADLMLAYEGFAYRPGPLALREGNGGAGWRGPWRAAAKSEAYREIEDLVANLSIVSSEAPLPWPLPAGQSGALEVPAGTRSLVRPLAKPIALDQDGITYFSFIVHEPDFTPGLKAWDFGGVRLVFRSSANPADLLSFGPSRARLPSVRMGDGQNFTSPAQVARNQDTLWIGKIIARRSGDDDIFFSVYGERDAFGFAEPATWQVATRGVRRNGRLDVVMIATQLSAACTVDELRIGPTWRSIAPMQELAAR